MKILVKNLIIIQVFAVIVMAMNIRSENLILIENNYLKQSFPAYSFSTIATQFYNNTNEFDITIDSIVLSNPRWDINLQFYPLPISIPKKGNQLLTISNIGSVHNLSFNLKYFVYFTIKELNTQLTALYNFYPEFKYNDIFDEVSYDKIGLELKNSLIKYLQNHVSLSYKDARIKMFGEVDNYDGIVECVYTGRKIQTTGIPDITKTGFNTEHSWPQSFFNEGDTAALSDIFHLYPTDQTANTKRANYPFDYVTQVQWQNGGTKLGKNSKGEMVYEPRDIQKGNTARGLFYFALRYGNPKQFLNSQEKVLREWCYKDTIDIKERERNNKIFEIQKRFNPFISHPGFLERIYRISTDEDFPQIFKPVFSTTYAKISTEYIISQKKFNFFITNAGNIPLNLNNIEIIDENGGLISKIEDNNFPKVIPIDSVLEITAILKELPEQKNQLSKIKITINDSNYQITLEEVGLTSISDKYDNLPVVYKNGALSLNLNSFIKTLEIVNVLGNTVFSTNIIEPKNSIAISLESGIYFVVLKNDYETFVQKILISN